MKVGFIGLGIMGRAMVGNLVRRGHDVSVWNRTVETAATTHPQLRCCQSPLELADICDIVIGCVSGPDAVDRVLFAPDGVGASTRPNLTYVECSTIGPAQGSSNEEELRRCGIQMLAAPVTGSKLGAENGTLLFMTGGTDLLNKQLEPLLMDMGERVIHCGSVEQAFTVKLANNSMVSFMLQGLCEGALALEKSKVPLQTWLSVIESSVLASRFHVFKGDALVRRDFSTHFSLDLLLKDQTLMLDLAKQISAPMPALSAIRDVFRRGQAQGFGADDMVGIIRALEQWANNQPS